MFFNPSMVGLFLAALAAVKFLGTVSLSVKILRYCINLAFLKRGSINLDQSKKFISVPLMKSDSLFSPLLPSSKKKYVICIR